VIFNINDVFWTVQGEGQNMGRRALFVRLPFCNLECSWCDTTFNSFEKWDEGKFLDFALQEKARFAVITGGEPMLNKHAKPIVELLLDRGFNVACESNGTAPVNAPYDFITVSPKRFSNAIGREPYYVNEETFKQVHEFRYVVDDQFDFSILNRHDTTDGRRYSLSPEFNQFDKNVVKILDYVKENPRWRISLQTHKWLKIP